MRTFTCNAQHTQGIEYEFELEVEDGATEEGIEEMITQAAVNIYDIWLKEKKDEG